MPKKPFRLESVLKLRQMELDNCRLELANRQRRLDEVQAQLNDKESELTVQNGVLSDLFSGGSFSPDELINQQRFCDQILRTIASLKEKFVQLSNDVAAQQDVVTEAYKEVKKLEKLKEKELENGE